MASDPLISVRTTQSKDDIELQNELKSSGKLPAHIAIIMDGNGRWAQKKGNIRLHGHKAGVKSVRDVTESCAQLGVNYLTLYAFSTENWNRPASEINGLMKLLVQSLRDETETLQKNDIKLITIGQTNRLPAKCRAQLQEVMDLTKNNKRMQLCLALSYSGRWDITEAVRSITHEVQKGNIAPDDVNDDLISSYLSTANIPDPDLIIRTSGEYRISNFLLWQLAYSELYITHTYWPDFRRDELYEAIRSYQSRDRRYGKLKNGYNKSIASTVINHIIS